MLSNTGIKKYSKRNSNYPKNRKSATGRKCYPWVKYPEGRTAKILICLIGDEISGETLSYEGNYSEQGVTDDLLYSRLQYKFPVFFDCYRIKTGNELTSHTIYERYHKMTHKETRAKEHPSNDPKLHPLVKKVEELYKRKGPISFLDAVEAGSYE